MQPRRLSTQTAHKQKDNREQLEATTQMLVETQEQLEDTHRQLVEVRRWQKETQEQLTKTRAQLEDTNSQLVEAQEQLTAAREQLRDAQESESLGNSLNEYDFIVDDLLDNKSWLKLTQECVTLFDELVRMSAGMDPRRQELAGYLCSQLEEILERCGVTIISGDSALMNDGIDPTLLTAGLQQVRLLKRRLVQVLL